ncbi:DsbA family protein [Sphingomonas sp. RS6]
MSARAFGRRDVAMLIAVGAGGYAASRLLRGTAPIGRDVSASGPAMAILGDRDVPAIGPADAGLTIVAFSDFQCPACRAAEPALRDACARDGRARLVFREWPVFGPRSEAAARVALAAIRQNRYDAVHRALMAERRPLDPPVLRAAVEGAGADWATIVADMEQHRADIERVLRNTAATAFAIGLPGTPGYMFGPLLVTGAQSLAGFRRALDEGRALQAKRTAA